MTGSLRLLRQLTSQDVPAKQRRALSLPLVRACEGWLFLHEHQVEECSAEPLATVIIANSCKLQTPSLFLPLPPPSLLPSALLHGGIRAAELDWTELTSLCSPLLLRCPEVESLMQLVFVVRNAEHQLKPAFTLVFQQYC